MNRILKFLKRHRYAFAAFFLPALIMTGAFASIGIFPFGENQITVIDMYHQFVPFLSEFQYKLQHGGSLLYSWDGAGGFNFWTTLAYYGGSPLNLILVLFPESWLVEGITLALILKIGFAGMFMYLYLKRTYPCRPGTFPGTKTADNWSKVAFGSLYALSAFVLAYYWCIMWMDVVALFPLCMLGLRRVIEEDRPVTYAVSLALIVFCNYYLSIMVCLFIVLYALVIYFGKPRTGGGYAFLETAGKTALYSVIGLAMSCAMFLPTWFAMKHAYYFADAAPEDWIFYNDPLEVFNQLLPNAQLSFREGLPNIYCGLIVVILLVFYYASRTIPLRQKVVNGLLLALFFFSLNLNRLDFVWHGLHFPNQLPYRYSFMICFVLVGLACQAFSRLDQIPLKTIWAVFAGGLAYYLLAGKILGEVVDNKDEFVYLGAALLGVYVLIMVLRSKGLLGRMSFTGLFVLVVAIEVFCSASIAFDKVGTVERDPYLAEKPAIQSMVQKEGKQFSRTELYRWGIMNCPTLYNYKGWSLFSSSLNADATTMMEQVGVEGEPGKNRYNYVYSSPVLNAMLNVNYIISTDEVMDDPHFSEIAAEDGAMLYRNRYPLAVGYMLPRSIRTWDTTSTNPFEVQDDYIRAATDGQVNGVFEDIGDPEVDSADLDVTIDGGGIMDASGGDGIAGMVDLRYTAPEEGSYYVFIEADMAETIQVFREDGSFTDLREDCGAVAYVGTMRKDEPFTVEINYQQDGQGAIRCHVCRLLEDEWEEAYPLLSRDQWKVTEYGDTWLKGKINVTEEGIFTTSVLYEKGWHLYVDGKGRRSMERIGGDFIGTPLTVGEHEIELRYRPEGLIPGILIMLLGIGALVVIQLRHKLRSRLKASSIRSKGI